jgi:hypothetical protein
MRTANRLFLVCVAGWLLAVGSASAQTLTAGVKAGAILTSIPHAGDVLDQISEAESVDVRAKLGATGGGFVQFAFSDRFSFQPELLFVMKGVKLDLPEDVGTVTGAINYLEFPLLARYTRSLNDVLDGYILVGPTFSVKAGTSGKFEGSPASVDLNLDPAIGSRDFGLAVGGGLERSRFLLEARYTFGLMDIATEIYEHPDSLRNRAFSVMIGVRLP